jgi:peroxiredoxin
VPIAEPALGQGDSYYVWVEGGWLQVKRQAKNGRIDWQIVLARAVDATPPAVTAKEGFIFEVSYKRGRYFVRETRNVIQSLRERKLGKDGTRPLGEFIDGTFQAANSGGAFPDAAPVLTLWRNPAWAVVTGAPTENRIDTLIRLDAADKVHGSGATVFRGTLRKCSWGDDAWVLDDGESLTATRRLAVDIEQERKLQAARASLRNAPAPELQAQSWINAGGSDWSARRGKVVLLDFWIHTSSTCIDNLARAQMLQDKLRKRGFAVIGVTNFGDPKDLKDTLRKQGASFAVALVGDKTLKKFGVDGMPAYYLVDRNGRVATGLMRTLPEENELEVLLGK